MTGRNQSSVISAPVRPNFSGSAAINNGRLEANGRAQIGGPNRNVYVQGGVSAGIGSRPTGSVQVGGQIRF